MGHVRVQPVDGDGVVYFDASYCSVYYQPKQSKQWIQLPLLSKQLMLPPTSLPMVHQYYMVTESSKVFLISMDGKNKDVFAFDLINIESQPQQAWQRVADIPILKTDRAFVAASHGKIHIIGQYVSNWNKDARLLTYDIAKNSWSFIILQADRPFGFGSIAMFLLRGRPLSLLGWFNRNIEVVDESGVFWVRNRRNGKMGSLLRRQNYLHFDVSTEFFFEKWTIAEYDIERDEVTGRFACGNYTKLMTAIIESWFDGGVVSFRVHGTMALLSIQYKGKQLVFKGTLSLTKKVVDWEEITLQTVPEATDIHSHLSSACTRSESFDGGLICQAGCRVYYQSKEDSTLDRWIELPTPPVEGIIIYNCKTKKLFMLEETAGKEFYMFSLMDLGSKSAAWCKLADMPTSKPNGVQFLSASASNGKIYVVPLGGDTMEIYNTKSNSWKVTTYNRFSWLTLMFDGRPLSVCDPGWQADLLDNRDFWVRPIWSIGRHMPLLTHTYDISTHFYSDGWDVGKYDIIEDKTTTFFFSDIPVLKDLHVAGALSRNGTRRHLRIQGRTALAIFKYEGQTVAFRGDLNAALKRVCWRLVALPPGAFRVLNA